MSVTLNGGERQPQYRDLNPDYSSYANKETSGRV
jgi:hypothetical protein